MFIRIFECQTIFLSSKADINEKGISLRLFYTYKTKKDKSEIHFTAELGLL